VHRGGIGYIEIAAHERNQLILREQRVWPAGNKRLPKLTTRAS
jgi:hypothetical protein